MRRRVLLVSLALLAVLVGIELALQAGAALLRATGRSLPTEWLTGDRRVLALGDSNTYGLYVERSQAWPSRLEAEWNGVDRRPAIEVLNVGYPAINSSRLLRDFDEMIETFRPDVTLVMIGVNDRWTLPIDVDPRDEGGSFVSELLDRSRVVRLLYMIRRGLDEREVVVVDDPHESLLKSDARLRYGDREFSVGFERRQGHVDESGAVHELPDREAAGRELERNLVALIARAREQDVELVLLSYPSMSGFYAVANRFIRSAAASEGVRLVDLEGVFAGLCPEEPCPDLFFPDHHPTALGHQIAADAVAAGLAADPPRS